MLVEDGTGVKNADSYASVAFFRAYHTARGRDVSGIIDADVEVLLIKATDFIENRWGPLFNGVRRCATLLSRSVLTLTDNPTDGETVTVGDTTITFRTTVTDASTEAAISYTAVLSLVNLAAFFSAEFADPDVAALTIFTEYDGVATTSVLADGSFDNAASTGASGNKQPLEFPRTGLVDSDGRRVLGNPLKLQQATAEYAYRANTVTLDPDPTYEASNMRVSRSRKKVGPLEKDISYSSSGLVTRGYPAADRLLSEYVSSGGRVIRA